MVIQILTSTQGDLAYYENRGFLRGALEAGHVKFQGEVHNHAPNAIVFDDKHRIYDFTRSAKSTIREDMTAYLRRVLPGIQQQDLPEIQEAFDCLFNYHAYKRYLEQVDQQRDESMYMLIFNDADGDEAQQYVAHVSFSSISRRTAPEQFTVNATLTCQRFTYFQLQEIDAEVLLQDLQNLHVHDD